MLKFSLFPLHFFFTISSSSTISPLPSTLRASDTNQSWSSPNSTFSLSFITITQSSYVLATTHNVGHVIVWSASNNATGAAVVVDSSGMLNFLRNGALRLVNGSGPIVWDSYIANRGVSLIEYESKGRRIRDS
ncbi:hypothetical protein like AT1G34300 [Hibiscus trionum]|uniref:Bulb-type lectin domain-containing protein n=1 Tax=Hibiscus trionum TaxID=183268 RepID=A0A9W7JGG9_HIBTR|nr:hypothetical protein like AT1G34300 [Hibiscus trionum]